MRGDGEETLKSRNCSSSLLRNKVMNDVLVMQWSTVQILSGLELYVLTRVNLENIMLSKKQVAKYEKYDIIYVKCVNNEKQYYIFIDKYAAQAYNHGQAD